MTHVLALRDKDCVQRLARRRINVNSTIRSGLLNPELTR